jgi:LPXTG-motif cell wall-anchored protein
VDGGKLAEGVTTTGLVSMTVENKRGSELPTTGGIGTRIFYLLGGILVLGAVILLITKKRTGSEA